MFLLSACQSTLQGGVGAYRYFMDQFWAGYCREAKRKQNRPLVPSHQTTPPFPVGRVAERSGSFNYDDCLWQSYHDSITNRPPSPCRGGHWPPACLPLGGRWQKSALRNRFLTEGENHKIIFLSPSLLLRCQPPRQRWPWGGGIEGPSRTPVPTRITGCGSFDPAAVVIVTWRAAGCLPYIGAVRLGWHRW